MFLIHKEIATSVTFKSEINWVIQAKYVTIWWWTAQFKIRLTFNQWLKYATCHNIWWQYFARQFSAEVSTKLEAEFTVLKLKQLQPQCTFGAGPKPE